jgi:hypothetical protein
VPGASSQGIFLSYRRADAAPYARLLQSLFTEQFPDVRVFMDLDSIEPGVDFAEAIGEAVDSCAVLVALIGRQWATAADEDGHPRIDDPDDYVRFEIQLALERGVRVIPVLVDAARPLQQHQLPAGLHKFARLNALELTHERYRYDADRLIDSIKHALAVLPAAGAVHQPSSTASAEALNVSHDVRPDGNVRGEAAQKDPEAVRSDQGRAARLIAGTLRTAAAPCRELTRRRRIALTSALLVLAVAGTGAGLWLSPSSPSPSAGPLKVNTCARAASDAPAPVKIGSITTGRRENDFVDIAFSPDCDIIAAGGNGIVQEWDMVTGNRIATLPAAPGSAVDIDAFTPDGKTLAVAGGDGNTTLWNAATGRLEARLPSDPSGGTYCLAISPDSPEIFTGGSTGVVGIWYVTTHQSVGAITTGVAVGAMALSPNGNLLAVAGYDGIIRVYDTASHAQVAALPGNAGHIWSMAFSPDGRTLAAGSNVVQWWDVATRKLIADRVSPGETVTDVAFSPDGAILAAGGNKMVGLWDARTHQLITTLNLGVTSAPAAYPNGMAFSRYGAILAVGWGGMLQFWNVVGVSRLSQ